jgi:hypothetical protein
MDRNPPQAFPHLQTATAIPDAPRNLSGTSQLKNTPNTLPFPSSSPKLDRTANPRSPSVPRAAAYKIPLQACYQTRTAPLSTLDILSSFLAPSFKPPVDDILADHHAFPVLLSLPRRRSCGRWPRRPSSAARTTRRCSLSL